MAEYRGHDHHGYNYDDDVWHDDDYDDDDYDSNVFTIWYFWLVIVIILCFFITCVRSCYQRKCCTSNSSGTATATVAYVDRTGGQTFAQEFGAPPNPGTFNHAYVVGPHMLSHGEPPKPDDLPPSYEDAIGYPVTSPPEVPACPSAPEVENSTE